MWTAVWQLKPTLKREADPSVCRMEGRDNKVRKTVGDLRAPVGPTFTTVPPQLVAPPPIAHGLPVKLGAPCTPRVEASVAKRSSVITSIRKVHLDTELTVPNSILEPAWHAARTMEMEALALQRLEHIQQQRAQPCAVVQPLPEDDCTDGDGDPMTVPMTAPNEDTPPVDFAAARPGCWNRAAFELLSVWRRWARRGDEAACDHSTHSYGTHIKDVHSVCRAGISPAGNEDLLAEGQTHTR